MINSVRKETPGIAMPPVSARESVLSACPVFLILAVAIACANNFADPDLWMHILVGRQIFPGGHIPLRDMYSYSAAGSSWRNHEWLAQVILSSSYDALGIFGLKLVKIALVTICMTALALGLSRTCASLRVQRLVLLGAAAGMVGQVQYRPQLITFAMLGILMALLAAEIYQGRTRLWLLIPVFVLWANCHGGYLVGLAVLGVVSTVIGAQDLLFGSGQRRFIRLAAITVACAAATLVNPFGIFLWPRVLHSISEPATRLFISDWQPLIPSIILAMKGSPPDVIQYAVPVMLFGAFGISLIVAPRWEDAALAAAALMLTAAALYAARNIALAVIALSIPLANHIGLAMRERGEDGGAVVSTPPAALILGAALLIALVCGELSNRLKTWAPVPAGAVAYMKTHNLNGNILNELGWGAYLVWHLAPKSHVFVDGRCELVYPDRVLLAYAAFLYGWPGGAELLNRYPHDLILIAPGSAAYRTVSGDSRWTQVYRDSSSALFVRSAPAVSAARPSPSGNAVEEFP